MTDRLDEIMGDPLGGNNLCALPVQDDQTIRDAVRWSVESNGIQATGEHWAVVLDTIGPVPQAYLDTVKIIFNQTVAECF